MNDNTKGSLIFIGIIVLLIILYISDNKSTNNDFYKAKISNYNHNICGTNFSMSDYLYEDEFDVEQLLDEIKEECNY